MLGGQSGALHKQASARRTFIRASAKAAIAPSPHPPHQSTALPPPPPQPRSSAQCANKRDASGSGCVASRHTTTRRLRCAARDHRGPCQAIQEGQGGRALGGAPTGLQTGCEVGGIPSQNWAPSDRFAGSTHHLAGFGPQPGAPHAHLQPLLEICQQPCGAARPAPRCVAVARRF